MSLQTPSGTPIVLIADTDSALAAPVALALAEQRFDIHRIVARECVPGEPVAAVFPVEHQLAIDTLCSTIDRSTVPTLVLAATHELAEAALPLLNTRHDLALATESAAVVAWRLRRLVERSRRSAMGLHSLDALTGLLNRSAFEGQLRRVAGSMAPDEVVGLLMLDLDRFKAINDYFGHVGGDRTLQAVGELLPRCLAAGDLVGRLGGDEFTCLMTRRDGDAILRDAAQLLKAISELDLSELRADPSLRRLTASAGLTFVRPSVEVGKLITEAEQAMYQAKNGGRDRLEVYGELANAAQRSSRDLGVQHFENVMRVSAERLVEMIAHKGRRLVDAARQEAYLCPLTGLYSRRYINEQLPREIARAHERGGALSLALIDLDHFHAVNTTHGWPTGDRALQAFARVVLASVRSSDWAARYGGEEFVIVMPGTTLDSARQVAERVRRAFASTTIESVEGQCVPATLSAGVAELAEGETSATALVQAASQALLRAKAAGRDRVE